MPPLILVLHAKNRTKEKKIGRKNRKRNRDEKKLSPLLVVLTLNSYYKALAELYYMFFPERLEDHHQQMEE